MPRLPTAQDLGVRSFQDRSSVVTQQVDTRGQDALVSAVSNISSRMNERLDASSLHKAKITFQKAKLEADAAFDQDPDFETYQERYDKKLETAVTESAGIVRNPRDRETFQRDMSLYRAQGTQNIIAKAFSKEVDRGLADLNETQAIARENFLRASNQQDKDFAVQISSDAINAAVEATHITEDEGQERRQAQAVGLAIASVEVAPPEKQIKLLKSSKGVMQYLPLDTRKDMLKNAEGQLSAQTVLDKSEAIRTEGGSLEVRLAKAHKIKDPKINKAVKAQVKMDHNDERTAEGQQQYETYDMVAKGIIADENLNVFIAENPKAWASLDSKHQEALIKRSETGTPNKTVSSVYNKLSEKKNGDKKKAYRYFLDNISSFSDAEARKQSDYFNGLAKEPKPLLTMNAMINIKSKPLKLDDDVLGEAKMLAAKEYETWSKNNPGESMSLGDQEGIVNLVFDKTVDERWYVADKRGFQLEKKPYDEVKLTKKYEEYKEKTGREPSASMKARIEEKMIKTGMIGNYQ